MEKIVVLIKTHVLELEEQKPKICFDIGIASFASQERIEDQGSVNILGNRV